MASLSAGAARGLMARGAFVLRRAFTGGSRNFTNHPPTRIWLRQDHAAGGHRSARERRTAASVVR